jgi:hypothetical protein
VVRALSLITPMTHWNMCQVSRRKGIPKLIDSKKRTAIGFISGVMDRANGQSQNFVNISIQLVYFFLGKSE